MLDEWGLHSYTMIPSLSLQVGKHEEQTEHITSLNCLVQVGGPRGASWSPTSFLQPQGL